MFHIHCTLIPGSNICKYFKNANCIDNIQNISTVETERGLRRNPKLPAIMILINNSLFLCLPLTNKSESVKGVSTRYSVKLESIGLYKFAQER